jgi:hypothetical protein
VLYHDQTAESICDAVHSFISIEKYFDRRAIQQHAKRFDTNIFARKMRAAIHDVMQDASLAPVPDEGFEIAALPLRR